MRLENLNRVFMATRDACASVLNKSDFILPGGFKTVYASLVACKKSFSRHDDARWLGGDALALHSRKNNTITFLPPVAFYIARELVPLYRQLIAYRSVLVEILGQYGLSLDKIPEKDCVRYIKNADSISEDEKEFLCKFVTDGEWWGKGRQIERAQDFFESPLMKCSQMTQETGSEIARLTRQLSDELGLLDALNTDGLWLEKEFKSWYLEHRCKGENKTESNSSLRHYSSALNSLSAEQGVHDSEKWCGVFEFLLGYKPKPVFSIGTIVEFDTVYGEFAKVLGENPDAKFDKEKYEACHNYFTGPRDAPYLTDHGNFSAAYGAYRAFLVWYETLGRSAFDKGDRRFWTYSPGRDASAWDEVQKDGVIALRFTEVGDFSKLGDKAAITAAFHETVGDDASHKNGVDAVVGFRDVMKPGDIIFAKKGRSTFLGVGRITGEFYYDSEKPEFPNRRKIDWIKIETHEIDDQAALKTLTDITSCPDFVEKLLKAYGLDQTGNQVKSPEDESLKGDVLTIALRCFEQARKDDPKYHAAEDTAREWFKDFSEEKLKANFEYFRSKMIWAAMVRAQITKDYEQVDALATVLGELKKDPRPAEYYVSDAFRDRLKNECPGVGRATIFDMLMKMHPDSYGAYNGMMKNSLVFLGLLPEKSGDKITSDVYRRVMGVYETIRERMREMQIGIHPEGDYLPPDFLVVNEFLWFVDDQKNLIKEKVMAKEFKKVTRKPKADGKKKLSDMMKDDLLKRLAAALRTKPFAILAGHSGTGKSQMVRRLAYMTCADEGLMAEATEKNAPGNYCMIQVRPNWHDSTDLLGYYSEMSGKFRSTPFVNFVAKAYAYPDIPFFVCLDEMNLAPVEQYFAEYLSAVESASDKSGQRLTDPLVPKTYAADEVIDDAEVRFNESKAWYEAHGLTLPKNLFVVGTVNMDDTTCQFSRKVLDRAMTIMMDKVTFEDMMDASKSVEPSEDDLLEPGDIAQFLGGELRAQPLDINQVQLLKAVDSVLGKTPFAVAYRFANEYALYEASLIALTGAGKSEETSKAALDHCVLMKVLPRIHGERKEMELLFRGKPDSVDTGLEGVLDKVTTLSGKKMEEILDRKAGYLSFWP